MRKRQRVPSHRVSSTSMVREGLKARAKPRKGLMQYRSQGRPAPRFLAMAQARQLKDLRDGSPALFAPDRQEADRVRPALSRREVEILGLVAVGLASREIADRLFISVATVNNHRQRILEKMQVRNSAEAVRYASELGILQN